MSYSVDKSWVRLDRLTPQYDHGLRTFLDFCFANVAVDNQIKCPCRKCYNRFWRSRKDVEDDMVEFGMDHRYVDTVWTNHGEQIAESNTMTPHTNSNMHYVMEDLFHNYGGEHDGSTSDPATHVGPTEDALRFYNLLKEVDVELYPGASHMKKLEFIVELYHIKCLFSWSDKSFSTLLALLKRSFPLVNSLPDSFYKTKKLIGELGLNYEKIDACPNDCMLYRNEHKDAVVCKVCGDPRYSDEGNENKNRVPLKVLRYFPVTTRLQRLFMSRHTAQHMTWHKTESTDGIMRHPSDSPAWKELDKRYPDFALEPRNVRFGLASDGFNPFGHMSLSHSTWPVVLCVYNLPPWMCMTQPYLIMSLLIPGPKAPGNDIDIYLEPLIDELTTLWNDGVSTYDVHTNQTFTLRAALLWTINDFPAYANLSGWSTKGELACPQCQEKTEHLYLPCSRKQCYLGHRRFLPMTHRFRKEKVAFNGQWELRPAPAALSGEACLLNLSGLSFTLGKKKKNKNRPRQRRASAPTIPEYQGPWKKQSVFFRLPYWRYNLLRHNLDVMHIEKNVCDSIIGTLLGLDGKNKDTVKARGDLEKLNLKPELHPVRIGSKTFLPAAAYTLTNKEKEMFCEVLKNVKVPDGYSSNIARCVSVKEKKIMGLKSHDCHVLLQTLVPLAVRRILPPRVAGIILEMCSFFKNICVKAATPQAFIDLNPRIALTLCQMERIFPPAFFDIMLHLPIHLASEAAIGGPVQYRWMYPIERYLHTLKSYVRNKRRPEGCIAEGYIAEECMSFCSMYLDDVDTRRNRFGRNSNDGSHSLREGFEIFAGRGIQMGSGTTKFLDYTIWEQLWRSCLFNCAEVEPYLSEHMATCLTARGRRTTIMTCTAQATDSFPHVFKQLVETMLVNGNHVHPDLGAISFGPSQWAMHLKSFVINGFRFRIKSVDVRKKNQNCGIFVAANTPSYSSTRDQRPITALVDFYGVVIDIVKLDFGDGRTCVLFDCEWVDNHVGSKVDAFGFKLVNFKKKLNTKDTFVLATQAKQVFYVQDPLDPDWHVIVDTEPRDLYDMNLVVPSDVYGVQT